MSMCNVGIFTLPLHPAVRSAHAGQGSVDQGLPLLSELILHHMPSPHTTHHPHFQPNSREQGCNGHTRSISPGAVHCGVV
ncbi:hypothetical protein FA13DRAFT_204985 [Coprinellus micaceus]|uniref:Uncharacterized protein n=1 Tax=Coprinellus micaceus TaxID=71717 RepID=A0A4Y7SG01_COPMI|nr:hypothetical protein FA13DRAFT_204985 [Coprinellus micaceus]